MAHGLQPAARGAAPSPRRRPGPGVRTRNPVIACPVCSHVARAQRTATGGLRVLCAHCSAAYSVDAGGR